MSEKAQNKPLLRQTTLQRSLRPRDVAKGSGSFAFVAGYARRECCSISMGVLFMAFASAGELFMPWYIGRVVDMMGQRDFDGVASLSGYMLIVTFVSTL